VNEGSDLEGFDEAVRLREMSPQVHECVAYSPSIGFDVLVADHRRQRDDFIAAASAFCDLYERATQLGGERLFLGLQQVLPRLQAAAVELPLPDEDLPDDDLDVRLTTEESQAVDTPVYELLKQLDWRTVQHSLSESTAGLASPAAADPVLL
jgi:hypothetical protein